jgi:hypothetical protein
VVDNCDSFASCTDTTGSFTCACNAGWTGSGVSCTNQNECTLSLHNCAAGAFCTDTSGSFACTCNVGWSGSGLSCANLNECTLDVDNCHVNATCTDIVGSFTCACNRGFDGSGTACVSLSECVGDTHDCHDNATCVDAVGSFFCHCNAGWTGNGTACASIDECALELHSCHASAECVDLPGSFNCACADGYVLASGVWCNDVDECAAGSHGCHANAVCNNTAGAFSCVSDAPGRVTVAFALTITNRTAFDAAAISTAVRSAFRLLASDRIFVSLVALARRRSEGTVNVTVETNSSGLNGTLDAINNETLPDNMTLATEPSSQPIDCNAGYWGDGELCVDVDECAGDPAPCASNGACVNADGGYSCDCDAGYTQVDDSCLPTPTPPPPQAADDGMPREMLVAIVAGVSFFVVVGGLLAWATCQSPNLKSS